MKPNGNGAEPVSDALTLSDTPSESDIQPAIDAFVKNVTCPAAESLADPDFDREAAVAHVLGCMAVASRAFSHAVADLRLMAVDNDASFPGLEIPRRLAAIEDAWEHFGRAFSKMEMQATLTAKLP